MRRQSNRAAHILAREAFNVMGCVVWVEDTPNVIANQIQLDVNVMDSLSYVMKVMFSLSKKKKKKA